MSLAPITGDGGKLAAQAADQTQKTTPVQEFQGILKNGLNAIKEVKCYTNVVTVVANKI